MPQIWTSIYTAIGRAVRWAERPEGPKRAFNLNLNPTPDELAAYLVDARRLSVDVETDRNYPPHIELCGVSKGSDSAVVFPWTAEFIPIIRASLQNPNTVKIGHNFGFDQIAFMAADCDVAWPIVDTIQAESLLRPPFREAKKRRWLALTTCVLGYYDGWGYWKDEDDPVTKAFFRAAFPHVPDWLHRRLYCAIDCIATWLLWNAQAPALEKAGMYRVYSEIVAPAGPTLVRMENRGIPVDEPRRALLLGVLDQKIGHLTKEIGQFAAEHHARRLARIEAAVASLKELEAHELQTHPLFTSAGEELDTDVALRPCVDHVDYRGLTKREKCPGCVAIFKGAGSLRAKIKDLRARAAKGRSRIKQLGPTFKETSDDHWRYLLFDPNALGLVPTAFTDKRELPKVDDDSIEALLRGHPEIPILSARVGLQHALHTKGVLELPVDGNGRAHFVCSQHRTETQRIASGTDDDEDNKTRTSSGGNLQNKKDLERSIFCAGHEDFVFVEGDWSQIELRDMAWLARDTDLLDALRRRLDIHSLNAAAIFGCGESKKEAEAFLVPFEGMMRPARHAAKRGTHGWDYGMGARKTGSMFQPCSKMSVEEVAALVVRKWYESGREVGVSPDTVRRLRGGGPAAVARLYEYANTAVADGWIKAYFRRWPGLLAFQKRVVSMVERDGFLVNSFGYKLKFWNFDFKNGRRVLKDREEALAFWPQSDVAFMTKTLLHHRGQMDECFAKHGGELLITNHDAFAGRVPKTALSDFVPAARLLMERPWPQLGEIDGFGAFAVPADFMVGWNWGKRHVHGEKCDPKTCDAVENPRGLVEYREAA